MNRRCTDPHTTCSNGYWLRPAEPADDRRDSATAPNGTGLPLLLMVFAAIFFAACAAAALIALLTPA